MSGSVRSIQAGKRLRIARSRTSCRAYSALSHFWAAIPTGTPARILPTCVNSTLPRRSAANFVYSTADGQVSRPGRPPQAGCGLAGFGRPEMGSRHSVGRFVNSLSRIARVKTRSVRFKRACSYQKPVCRLPAKYDERQSRAQRMPLARRLIRFGNTPSKILHHRQPCGR